MKNPLLFDPTDRVEVWGLRVWWACVVVFIGCVIAETVLTILQ